MRIAMWSGPRNLSTAMMYAFGARNDCAVWDEPYYAAYLAATGLDHPMRQDILAAGEVDARAVTKRCLGGIPDAKPMFYQKHMTQHMLPQFDRAWLGEVTNIFLIRDPASVIASYHAKRENPTLEDIGFRQQAELFEQVVEQTGQVPAVVDSADILENPEEELKSLCEYIGLEFQDAMLSWPAGGHKDDGAWAAHWYKSVWKSTGFGAGERTTAALSNEGHAILKQAQPYYDLLREHRLKT